MVKVQIFVGSYKAKQETVKRGNYANQRNKILRDMSVDVDEEDNENCFCISLYCDEILLIF